jgi:hypothetical protein
LAFTGIFSIWAFAELTTTCTNEDVLRVSPVFGEKVPRKEIDVLMTTQA